MRAFIAIELPQKIRDALSAMQLQLESIGADVRWVEPQNIHLTLKFLGELDDKKLNGITAILEEISPQHKQFWINISSLGAFPKVNYPRVIWAGINHGDSETKKIAQELEEKIVEIGIPKEERPFSAHITIGRVRSELNLARLAQRLKQMAEIKDTDLRFPATTISLFKSTLTPKGPIYECIKAVTLGQPEG